MQQENDRLHARRFQLELERGDRLQRIVDLEAEVHTLEENADAYEIERLTLLQNIADMQHQVEEAEVQVAALQAIVITAATSGAGTTGGAAVSVRSGPDKSDRSTPTDTTSFACG
jgi:gamma-glutamyltranspeptidase